MEPPGAGEVNAITFTDGIATDYRLLEVDDAMIEEMVTSGLTIKGNENDEAVLCTKNKTYAIKQVETSNSVFLIPPKSHHLSQHVDEMDDDTENMSPLQQGAAGEGGHEEGYLTQVKKMGTAKRRAHVVTAQVSSHLELVEVAPRFEQLDAILEHDMYGGGDEDCSDDAEDEAWAAMGEGPGSRAKGHTLRHILEQVQASEAQVAAALREAGALEIDGRWRVVDPEYLGTLLEVLLLTCVEKDWDLASVPADEAAAALRPHGYIPQVVRHCLATFGSPAGAAGAAAGGGGGGGGAGAGAGAEQGAGGAEAAAGAAGAGGGGVGGGGAAGEEEEGRGGRFAFDEELVCRHFASSLLTRRRGLWPRARFLSDWAAACPSSFTPSPPMLRGLALLEGGTVEPQLKSFSVRDLPASPGERFEALFAERPQWEEADLMPYLEGIRAAPGQNVEVLLLKYTRASKPHPDQPPVFHRR